MGQAGLRSRLQARGQAERGDPAQTIDALTRVNIACRYLGHGKSWYDTRQSLFVAAIAAKPAYKDPLRFTVLGGYPFGVSRHRLSSATKARGRPSHWEKLTLAYSSPFIDCANRFEGICDVQRTNHRKKFENHRFCMGKKVDMRSTNKSSERFYDLISRRV